MEGLIGRLPFSKRRVPWAPIQRYTCLTQIRLTWGITMHNNTIYIAYRANTGEDLKLAKSVNGGLNWTLTVLETQGTVGTDPTLYVSDANQAYMGHYDAQQHHLHRISCQYG